MPGSTHWPRWPASPCAHPFRRKICIARSIGLFPRRFVSPKPERYEVLFMRGIRRSPRPTSTESSVRPSARPSWRVMFTPVPGRSIWMRSRLAPGSSRGNTISRALPRAIPSGRAPTGALILWTKTWLEFQAPRTAPARLQQTTIRTIYSSAWEQRQSEAGELFVYRVRGNGFLHHMVRNLVGTMIDVGRGQLALEEIPGILAACSRSAAGPTAPARGLFLHSVEYDFYQADFLLASDSDCGTSHR